MKTVKFIPLYLVLLVFGSMLSTSAQIVVSNPNFNSPDASKYSTSNYIYLNIDNGDQGGWSFSSFEGMGAGLGQNGSDIGVSNAIGNQAAFLQSNEKDHKCFVFQDVTFGANDVGDYKITFAIEGRNGQDNPIKVVFGPSPATKDLSGLATVGTFSRTDPTGQTFNTVTTATVSVTTPGTYRLGFAGTATGDLTSFIQAVNIIAVQAKPNGDSK